MELLTPPPVRRLDPDDPLPAREAEPAPAPSNGIRGTGVAAGSASQFTKHRKIGAPQLSIPRMEIDNLSVCYGQKLAVKAVSLPVRQGEVLALIGPSGCGKTTLLRSLNRLTELTRTASLSRPDHARRRRHHR